MKMCKKCWANEKPGGGNSDMHIFNGLWRTNE